MKIGDVVILGYTWTPQTQDVANAGRTQTTKYRIKNCRTVKYQKRETRQAYIHYEQAQSTIYLFHLKFSPFYSKTSDMIREIITH